MNDLIEEFKSFLPTQNEEKDIGEIIDFSNINIEDYKETEEEVKQREYLESLKDEDLYKLISAFDIGKSSIISKNELQKDIEYFGGKKELFQKNTINVKKAYNTRKNAIYEFTGLQGFWVRQCLEAFQNDFSF